MNQTELESFFRLKDLPSYFAMAALKKLKGERIERHRRHIMDFLQYKYDEIPLEQYLRRINGLRELQHQFERTKTYAASSYVRVRPINDDDYKIALLLSFVVTNHRFEILESLEEFLRAECFGAKELLSIGFGTGYELKVVHDILPHWRYQAYDNSSASFQYASELLRFFHCPVVGLREASFPLEEENLPKEFEGRFSKIVLCELLEHLENPGTALRNMGLALQRDGMIFATLAINIAQEDHVYLYRTVENARRQVQSAGLRILRERIAPVIVMPFREKDREAIFTKGNYICFLGKD